MKEKLSISLDKATLDLIRTSLEKGKFRNKSHAIEYAIKQLLEVE